MNYELLSYALIETPVYELQLPLGIREYALDRFKEQLDALYHPDLIILPLTIEGELQREYLYDYHHDDNGNLIHQSINRYGAYEYNFKFDDGTYLAILVNND